MPRANPELPHDETLERCALQMCLNEAKTRPLLLAHLEPAHFYLQPHRALWQAIQRLQRDNPEWNAIIEGAGLVKQSGIDSLYLIVTLQESNYWVAPATAKTLIRKLRELHRARRKVEIGMALADDIDPEQIPPLLAELETPVWAAEENKDSTPLHLAEVTRQDYLLAEELVASGRRWRGLDCGFPSINDRLKGLCPGQLTVLAARPKIGKSTLAIQMALAVAQREGVPVGIISLEMTREQVGAKLACLLADVDSQEQQAGRLAGMNREMYIQSMDDLEKLPIHVWVRERRIEEISARIRAEKEIRFWIVDHLHRIQGQGENDHIRYGSSAERLANLAVDTGTHILLPCQLNRACEERPDKMPEIGDLRASGSIEEHAVNVLLIYRPGFYQVLREKAKTDPMALDLLMRDVRLLTEATRFGVPGEDHREWIGNRGTFVDNAAPINMAPPRPTMPPVAHRAIAVEPETLSF